MTTTTVTLGDDRASVLTAYGAAVLGVLAAQEQIGDLSDQQCADLSVLLWDAFNACTRRSARLAAQRLMHEGGDAR